MADTAPRRFQFALEDAFTAGANSVYNGGTAKVATRRLAVEESVGADWKPTFSRPIEARGNYAGGYQTLLEEIEVDGKIPSYVYCDDLCYTGRMTWSGAPTVTTLPATPTVLLAAIAIAATMSLTTQPNAGGDGAVAKILGVTLAKVGGDSTAVNVTITGTDVRGLPLTETLNFTAGVNTPSKVSGSGSTTLYTQNYFKTVNAAGIACSAQPATVTLAVGGVNAFLWTFLPDLQTSTIMSATGEYDDGTAAWQLPGVVVSKSDFSLQVGKSFKLDQSFMAQKKTPLAGSTGSINVAAPAGSRQAIQNLPDNAMAALSSALANFYADPQGSAYGTTAVPARIIEHKFGVDNSIKLGKAGDGTPYPTFVGRDYYSDKLSVEFTLLFNSYNAGTTDPAELAQFLAYASRNIRVAVPGAPLPCGVLTAPSGWPPALLQGGFGGYYGVMFDSSGKYTVAAEKKVDGRMALSFKQANEVDVVGLGVGYVVTVVARINPNMV